MWVRACPLRFPSRLFLTLFSRSSDIPTLLNPVEVNSKTAGSLGRAKFLTGSQQKQPCYHLMDLPSAEAVMSLYVTSEFIAQFVVLDGQVVLSCLSGSSLLSLLHRSALSHNRSQRALKRKSQGVFSPHLLWVKKLVVIKMNRERRCPHIPDISGISQLAPLGKSEGQSSSKSPQEEGIRSYADVLFTVNSEGLTPCVGFQAFVMDEYLCFSGVKFTASFQESKKNQTQFDLHP